MLITGEFAAGRPRAMTPALTVFPLSNSTPPATRAPPTPTGISANSPTATPSPLRRADSSDAKLAVPEALTGCSAQSVTCSRAYQSLQRATIGVQVSVLETSWILQPESKHSVQTYVSDPDEGERKNRKVIRRGGVNSQR
jgi:hypothetical protein